MGENQNPLHEEVAAGVQLRVVVEVGDPGVVVAITEANGRNAPNGVRTEGRHTLLPATLRAAAVITAERAANILPKVESPLVVQTIPPEEGADTVVRHKRPVGRQYLGVSLTMDLRTQPLTPLEGMATRLLQELVLQPVQVDPQVDLVPLLTLEMPSKHQRASITMPLQTLEHQLQLHRYRVASMMISQILPTIE